MSEYYDDPAFFAAYRKMARSSGLQFAGEWHQLEPMIPALTGKKALDLGCGMGWHCRYMADHGAAGVLGIDASRTMLEQAGKINASPVVTYRHCDIREFEYPEDTYDLVLSNLVLHYVEDLQDIYGKVFRTLRSGGTFLFNIEHPTFTAGIRQEWMLDGEGKILCWPVDNYYYPGERVTDFLGFEIRKYHHTLSQILNPLIRLGFTLQEVEEAQPPESMMDILGMKDEMRRPMMLLVKGQKKQK